MATDAARLGQARTGARPKETESEERQDRSAMERAWEEPEGLWGFLTSVQTVRLGRRLIVLAFLFFLLGGINAAFIRFQLAQPNNSLVTPVQYDQLFTMHGSTMIFLFVVPFMLGLSLLLLPLVVGARTVPWPRLAAFVFWTFTFGGLLLESSWLFGMVPDAGWTAYAPLTEKAFSPSSGLDFWLLALMMVSIAGFLGSAILITTVAKLRAPGMSLNRMPLFAWAVLTMSVAMFLAFVVIFCGSAFLEFDRKFGTHFFDPNGGGSPLLWQYLFWLFGHPAVYLQIIPAAGITSLLLPVIIRQCVIGYGYLAAAFANIAVVSFMLWMDHMSLTGLSPILMVFFTIATLIFAIMVTIQLSAWFATIRSGTGRWNTAYLFILGFIFLSILGVVTGVMLALYPFDAQVHDSFFVVAHLHYYLFGTVVFPIFAGLYYWFPKFLGRFLDERLGKWNFWLMFAGLNIAFFPMYILGLLGMPRRLYTYPSIAELNILNLISTAGALILVSGILVFLANLLVSFVHGREAAENPWGADSLEWATDSPVPAYGFRHIPIVQNRNPLWDEGRSDAANEKTIGLVDRLSEWPNTWRAALVTSTASGEPEQVYGVAGPSVWPLVAAIGTALVFIAFFFDQLVLLAFLALGVIILLVSLIGWRKPTREIQSIPSSELDEFRDSYGVTVHPLGSPAITLWAVMLTVLGLAAALAAAIFCYLYLRSHSPVWPPNGIARPDSSVPLIATAVLVACEVLLLLGSRAVINLPRGARSHSDLVRLGLGGAFLLGLAFLVLLVRSYTLPPLTPTTNAYGSIFYGIGVLMAVVVLIGLGVLIGTLLSVWRMYHGGWNAFAVKNAALYWAFIFVAWLVVLATLYLAT